VQSSGIAAFLLPASLQPTITEAMEALMRNKLATILVALLVLSGGAVLSACNTTAGAGKDISAAGRAISNTAESAR